MNPPISTLMHRDIVTVTMDASVAEVERTLSEGRRSWAPVREGDAILGVVSLADLARFHAEGRDAASAKAWQLCTYKPVCVHPDDRLADVARAMAERHIHHVVVMDERGEPAGVVSSLDIVGLVAAASARD